MHVKIFVDLFRAFDEGIVHLDMLMTSPGRSSAPASKLQPQLGVSSTET